MGVQFAFCKIIVEFVDGTKLVRVKSGSKGDKNSIQIYNREDELIYEKLKADKAYDQFVTDFFLNLLYRLLDFLSKIILLKYIT